MNSFRIPAETNIRHAHLRVSNLEQSLKFYAGLLGLKEIQRENSTAHLAIDAKNPPIVILTEDRHAPARSRSSPGLFHTAILYPNRKELAAIFRHISEQGWKFQGFADHGVSESLYLADSEGNGVELYADKPREQWPLMNDGTIKMVTEPLDVENLIAESSDGDKMQAGVWARIGHIHLQVSDLKKAERFYREILGFDVTQRSYPGALFVSAGGYHHHLGLNIWNSRGSPPAPPNTLGLMKYGIEVPDRQAVEQLSRQLKEFQYPFETFEEKSGLVLRDFDNIQVEILIKP